jgi:hypothetical protein
MIVREELRDVRSDVKAIRSELTELRDTVGYRKEIDHALERIAAIEKHLGLNKKNRGVRLLRERHVQHLVH